MNKIIPLGTITNGDAVADLHAALKKLMNAEIPAAEIANKQFGETTRKYVKLFQERVGINPSGIVDEKTAFLMNEKLGLNDKDKGISAKGKIYFENGLPAAAVKLQFFQVGFGGKRERLGEVRTDENGNYELPQSGNTELANIEVVAIDTANNQVPISKTIYNATKLEGLNLVAPLSILKNDMEYGRLMDDIKKVNNDVSLTAALENDKQQDITLLARSTGWDARLVATAATAASVSQKVGITEKAAYAMLRLGMPADIAQLSKIGEQGIAKGLKIANLAGIATFTDEEIKSAQQAYGDFSFTTRQTITSAGAVSSLGSLLKNTELDATKMRQFEALNNKYQGAKLWEEAAVIGIAPAALNKMKTQGKLAFLTHNSAPLSQKLMEKINKPEDMVKLADMGYYKAEKWQQDILDMAGNDEEKLKALLPPLAEGETVKEKLADYTQGMARKVKRNYPTRVMRMMIETNELKNIAEKDSVKTFLNNAEKLGFDAGTTPIEHFIREKEQQLFAGISPDKKNATASVIRKVQRVQQLTPSDEAMVVLHDLGFGSAFDIVAFPYEMFMERYARRFPSRKQAELVYRKAEQISSVTYNFYTIANGLTANQEVAALAAPPEEREIVRNELIKHFPTMETLFGSMDFCECEHCRSVLSPAAYLADLLHFLEPVDKLWLEKMEMWKDTHGGATYPFKDMPAFEKYKNDWLAAHPGSVPTDILSTERRPVEFLEQRRPDIFHLPLTCENTNIALPYIDIVNEILEYYVAHDGALAPEAVHDIGNATTAELLAEPQYIIPEAYDTLRKAVYPLGLPFDQQLESIRAFCNYFESPFAEIMEQFRTTDELYVPAAPFDRARIFCEYLGLSPAEYRVFTDKEVHTKWYELYGFAAENEALISLMSAKKLSRRLNITYKDLRKIIETGFINPKLKDLALLHKLDLRIEDILRYKETTGYKPLTTEEKEAVDKSISNVAAKYGKTEAEVKGWLDEITQPAELKEILLLNDPDTGCNFDLTILRFANGDAVDKLALLKINLLVRLWKKLSGPIGETDLLLQVFLPKDTAVTIDNTSEKFSTVLLYAAHLKKLEALLSPGKNGRTRLLVLWNNLFTEGAGSLYSQLFLSKSILRSDPVFDDPLGLYLSTPGKFIKDHIPAIQSAMGLSAADIELVITGNGLTLNNAPLNIPFLSVLYRHSLLARLLKMPVKDLLILKRLSGLDPFHALQPGNVTVLADDHPFNHTIAFVQLANTLQESRLPIDQLDYWLSHHYDAAGPYRRDAEAGALFGRALLNEISRIETENKVPADASLFTTELLQEKLALIFPPEIVTTFSAMLNGTITYRAQKEAVVETSKLDPVHWADHAAIRLEFDAVRKIQSLTYTGVLTNTEKTKLGLVHPSALFTELLDKVAASSVNFFNLHFVRDRAPFKGFLSVADFDTLFDPLPVIMENAGNMEQQRKQIAEIINNRRLLLARSFLPFLSKKLTGQAILQFIVQETGADAMTAETLLNDDAILNGLPETFEAITRRGLTVRYFSTTDATGAPSKEDIVNAISTKDIQPAPNSATWEGWIEVPVSGAYRFFTLMARNGAEAEIRIGRSSDAFIRVTATGANFEYSDFIELTAGLPYYFKATFRNLQGAEASLRVQTNDLSKGSISRVSLYPASVINAIEAALVRLKKITALIQALKLNHTELKHITKFKDDFKGLDLNNIPVTEDVSAAVTKLFEQFNSLVQYSRLKQQMGIEDESLISIFENARRKFATGTPNAMAQTNTEETLARLLAELTRRLPEQVVSTARQLKFEVTVTVSADSVRTEMKDVANPGSLMRLWNALQLVTKLTTDVKQVEHWTGFLKHGIADNDRNDIAAAIANTLKAHYETDAWLRIAQPIFDELRKLQRNALVSYIMHKNGFERQEQLFEYFLIDPGTEPVVQTSRIRLAISSVQLFIQRSLLNLELGISPSIILSEQWQWMKRYRFWEANRKIFLYPENWLEPEFRDDKTHLYQELESSLLQGDVSDQLVEDAFYQYLLKLEAMANMQVVTIYLEEKIDDPASNTLHVVARTFKQPYAYFYRSYAHNAWTPWEPVGAEIESDHAVLIKWKGKLHLFWVGFMEKAHLKEGSITNIENARDKMPGQITQVTVEMQLNWSDYFNGEWSPRSSTGFMESGASLTFNSSKLSSFNKKGVFIHATKVISEGEDGPVNIHLTGTIMKSFRLTSKNSIPVLEAALDAPAIPYKKEGLSVTHYSGNGPLQVSYDEVIKTDDNNVTTTTPQTKDILGKSKSFSLFFPGNFSTIGTGDIGQLVTPFFYQDDQQGEQTYFVEPSLEEKTFDQWEEWIIRVPEPDVDWDDDLWYRDIPVSPVFPIPRGNGGIDPRVVGPVLPYARFKLEVKPDWLTSDSTVINFDKSFIGREGSLPISTLKLNALNMVDNIDTITRATSSLVNINPGSAIDNGTILVRNDDSGRLINERDGLTHITVLGNRGLNPTALRSALNGHLQRRAGSLNIRL